MVPQDAIVQAIEAYRMPSRYRRPGRQQQPPGMLNVIKAAAGDDTILELTASEFQMTQNDVREACRHYLLKLLLDPSLRDLQILGLNSDASATEVRDHKRWLLKWLHPDRNPSLWEQALFHKIADLKDAGSGENQVTAAPAMSRAISSHRSLPGKKLRSSTQKPKSATSPWMMGLRMVGPLVATVFLAAVLIWLMGSVLQEQTNPFQWLEEWAKR